MENSVKTTLTARVIAACLVVLAFAEIVFQFAGDAQAVARFAFIFLCISMVLHFKLREWVLFGFAGIITFILLQKQNGQTDFLNALDKAAFFAGFIYVVTVLKEAAQRSPSVVQLGEYLAQQPSGRRYYAMAFGGHVSGILLNFGAISLLSPLIQRGVRAKAGATDAQRKRAKNLEQQQISALIRGFTWMVLWSPTSLAQVVLFTTIPDADFRVTIPMGIAATVLMIFLGRAEDRTRWRTRLRNDEILPPAFPARAAKRFSLICIAIILPTIIVSNLADVSLVIALMLVIPILIALWFFEQCFDGNAIRSAKTAQRNITHMLCASALGSGHNAITLGIAGFIGVSASKIAPVAAMSQTLEALNMPEWLLLASLPLIITLCGQIALSPILTVVFLGSVLTQFETAPADPNLLFFALGFGWALSMVASPNASASLLISGITNIPSTTITWRWNGIYGILCYGVFIAAMILLTAF
jgi:hypothetical protein